MFICAEVRLDVGFNAARARLANLAHDGLLRHASDDAYHDLGSGLVRVGPLGAAPGMSKLVAVQFSEMMVHEDSAVGAMRWEPPGPGGGRFPGREATLRPPPQGTTSPGPPVSGVTRHRSTALGGGWDGGVMGGVARAPARTFTHRIGAAITHPGAPLPAEQTPACPGFPPRPEPEET